MDNNFQTELDPCLTGAIHHSVTWSKSVTRTFNNPTFYDNYSPDDGEEVLPVPKSTENQPFDSQHERTGSPFDFLNEVLNQEPDLNKSKQAFNSPESKDLINQYGPNMTIFAPNDAAFSSLPLDWNDDEKKKFLNNHVIVGQRVPIYRFNEQNTPLDITDNKPKMIKANMFQATSPLVHKIDQLQKKPIGPLMIMSLQPVLSFMAKLIKLANFEPHFKKQTTFFCPYNNPITRNIAENAGPIKVDKVKEFLSDHMVLGMLGCQRGMTNLNGNQIDCRETGSTIQINQKKYPKREIPTVLGIIYIIDNVIFEDAPYMNQLLPVLAAPRIYITMRLGKPDDRNQTDSFNHLRFERQNRPTPAQVLRQSGLFKNKKPNSKSSSFEPQQKEQEPEIEQQEPEDSKVEQRPRKTKRPNPRSKSKKKPTKKTEEPNSKPGSSKLQQQKPDSEPKKSEEPPEKTKPKLKPIKLFQKSDNPEEKPDEYKPDDQENSEDKPDEEKPENDQENPEDKPDEEKPEYDQENPEDKLDEEKPENDQENPKNKPDEEKPEDDQENPEDKPDEEKPEDDQENPEDKPDEEKPDDQENPEDKLDEYKPDDQENSEDKPDKEKPEYDQENPEDKPDEEKPEYDQENPEDKPDEEKPDDQENPEDKLDEYKPDDQENSEDKPDKEKPEYDQENPEDKPEEEKPEYDQENPEDKPDEEKPEYSQENPEDKPDENNGQNEFKDIDNDEQKPEIDQYNPEEPKSEPNKTKKPSTKTIVDNEKSQQKQDPKDFEEPEQKSKKIHKKTKRPTSKQERKLKKLNRPQGKPEEEQNELQQEIDNDEPNLKVETTKIKKPNSKSEKFKTPEKLNKNPREKGQYKNQSNLKEPFFAKPQQTQEPKDNENPYLDQHESQESIEQKPEDFPPFEPSEMVKPKSLDPEEMKQLIQSSAHKLRCQRFVEWLINSGVLDEILKKAQQYNCTVFAPVDSASSQLPFNMLNSMQQHPQKNANLMRMHAVPQSFDSIYPSVKRSYSRSFFPINTLANNQIRFDRSLLPTSNTSQYQPLVSGCPLLDSHQIGPIRMVSTGSTLFPPQPSVYSVLKRSPNLKLSREIVDSAQMATQLDRLDRTYTMFTPTDSAILKRYSPRQLSSLVRDPIACKQFVNSHLVANRAIYMHSIPLTQQEQVNLNFPGRQAQVSNCNNEPLRLRRAAQSLYVNDGHVQYSDITTDNGVVHIMNDYI